MGNLPVYSTAFSPGKPTQILALGSSPTVSELLFDRHSRELPAIEPLCHGELPSSCPSRRFLSVRYRTPNFRLLHRLLTQIARLVETNALHTVTRQVVEAARESLVIGTA